MGRDGTRDNFYLSDSTLYSAKAQERVGLEFHFIEGETESQSNGAFTVVPELGRNPRILIVEPLTQTPPHAASLLSIF